METHQNNSEEKILVDTGIELISNYLSGLKITLICGGGIAAIEIPKLARELRRHGAQIQVCMTENSLKFIGIESIRWASQNEVILHASGLSEHICTSDALVVVPATADLISKIKNGICSDAATTFAQSALGTKIPVIICQTMHDSLANSPIIKENISALKNLSNVYFTKPRQIEGKQKIPNVEDLSLTISHIIHKHKLKKQAEILVTLGGTRVMLDPVRCLTNISTGKLGLDVSKTFYANGHNVTILAANTNIQIPMEQEFTIHNLPNYNDMFECANNIIPDKYDGLFHLVAASDFIPNQVEENKINSKIDILNIVLKPTQKLLSQTPLNKILYKSAAKLTAGLNETQELLDAKTFLMQQQLNAVLWNTSKFAWGDKLNHNGVFLKKSKDEILEIKVKNKKEISALYFKFFDEYWK